MLASRTIVQLDEADKLVGLSCGRFKRFLTLIAGTAYSQLKELPDIGLFFNPNIELIVSLKPDVIFGIVGSMYLDYANTIQEKTAIPVICVGAPGSQDFEIHQLVDTVIGEEREAEEQIIAWNPDIMIFRNPRNAPAYIPYIYY
jgi:ABC-type Fe3+-hydroxamate transport system substrate-binding protein